MDFQTIELLIERYFEGETTLSDEQALQAYFSGQEVHPTLEKYRPLFQYFKAQQQVTLSEAAKERISTQVNEHKQHRFRIGTRRAAWWAAAAAVAIISISSFLVLQNNKGEQLPTALSTDTYSEPQAALEEAKSALYLVSSKMNKGSRTTKRGLKETTKISKFFK